MNEQRRAAALAAVCALATFGAFAPSLRAPFLHWDDAVNVLANPYLNFRAAGLSWMLTGSLLGHWHPLTWMSFALDRALWGDDPFGFHLTNVLLHSLNAALLFLVARRLFSTMANDSRADLAAFFSSLFWSVHPLRVESVGWITERRDVLSGAFILASTLAYLRGVEHGEENGRKSRAAALILGSAAMASKVFAVTLPAVFLVLDSRLRGGLRWREKVPWILPAGIAALLNIGAQAEAAAVSLARFGWTARLAQAAYGLAFYPFKTVWPSSLSPLYERSLLLEPAPFLISAAAVVAGAAALLFVRRRNPSIFQAGLVYLFFLLPAVGLFKSGRMTAADRYTYLPAIPLSLLAGAALARLPRLVPPAVLLALALAVRAQLPVWNSDVALWTRACEVSGLSYFARLKLAAAQDAAGRKDEAAASRAAAARLHAEVFARAAAAHAARGDLAAAEADRARAAQGLQVAP